MFTPKTVPDTSGITPHAGDSDGEDGPIVTLVAARLNE